MSLGSWIISPATTTVNFRRYFIEMKILNKFQFQTHFLLDFSHPSCRILFGFTTASVCWANLRLENPFKMRRELLLNILAGNLSFLGRSQLSSRESWWDGCRQFGQLLTFFSTCESPGLRMTQVTSGVLKSACQNLGRFWCTLEF